MNRPYNNEEERKLVESRDPEVIAEQILIKKGLKASMKKTEEEKHSDKMLVAEGLEMNIGSALG